jgi:adenylate kinase
LKALGCKPKLIFVTGGPCSGKGTQCAKLVEEFGYQHLSVGDLMRAESKNGSDFGKDLAKTMADGRLVSTETTIKILFNGMMANPARTYLIDGFPRAVDQAILFEQTLLEVGVILHFEVTKETMFARCMKRAETSGRADDNEETINKRVDTYFESSEPVVAYY